MARFSALTLLVTVFYFFVCATQVSTPSHSDTSLRIIKIVPQLYPTLAISAPPPTRSPCAGLNRCSKTPIYGTWASRFVRSVNQARGYLNARNTIRPYLLRVDRYVHQITEMLGRPTPDSLVGLALMPTTGKAASPLVWARVEKAPAARPPPPLPPTRSLPVHFPPTPTSGPWNPPTPTTGYSRPRHAEPVVEVDSDDWSQQALSIGSTLILVAISFVWRFTKALPSVKCVEHRNSESDGAVPYCGAISSVVPPTTEPTASQVTQKPTIKPTVENQQSRPESPLITPPAAYSESTVSETTHRILDVVVWRSRTLVPTPIAPLEPATLIGLSTLAPRSQPSVTLSQLSRPDNILNHLDQIHSLLVTAERCVPLLIEWHTTTTEERLEVVSPPAITLIFTNAPTILHRRTSTILNHTFDFLAWTSSEEPRHPRARPVFGHHAPLLIEWYPTRNDVARQLETTYPPSHSETVSTSSFTLVPHTPTTFSPTHAFLRPTPWLPLKIISHEVLRPVTAQDPCARTTNTHDQGVAIGRRTPLLIGRLPEKSAEIILSSTQAVFGPSPSVQLDSTTTHLYTTPTTQVSYHLLRDFDVPSYTHTAHIPSFDHKINRPPARLLIEGHPLPQVTQSPDDETKVDPRPSEPSVSTSTPVIQPNPPPPPKPQAPLHIPLSFHRYGSIRLEDLDAYPPEKRQQVLRREIPLAEARYRHEKARRDRARLNARLMRSEMERNGKRLPKRRKSEEEVEEEDEMMRVMMARRRGEEEVFEGSGGPPPPVPEWLQTWSDMLVRECRAREKEKRSAKGKGKGKSVRWADDVGKSLVVERG